MQARKAPKAPKAQGRTYGAQHARASHAASACVVVAIARTEGGLYVVGRMLAPSGRAIGAPVAQPARSMPDAYRKGNATYAALADSVQPARSDAPSAWATPQRARVMRAECSA